jgi:hypothetical protein
MILPDIFLEFIRSKATKEQLINALEWVFEHYAEEMRVVEDQLQDKQRIINILDTEVYEQRKKLDSCYSYQAHMKRKNDILEKKLDEANDKNKNKTLN